MKTVRVAYLETVQKIYTLQVQDSLSLEEIEDLLTTDPEQFELDLEKEKPIESEVSYLEFLEDKHESNSNS